MEVFKGWYRKSSARKGAVWHRVDKVDSILIKEPMAITLCGKYIHTTKCNFNMNPDHMCLKCKMKKNINTGKAFVPIGLTSIKTRTSAIRELKRLLKQRIYYVRIWKPYSVCIKARWKSDTSVDIYIETLIISKLMKKRVFELSQVQTDLGNFKAAICCLCDASDDLAFEEKRKNKLKGRLTEKESNSYFEELLYEAEK